jgi:signal transduction histidine kinase
MTKPPIPADEASRLAELERLDVLDTEQEPEFQDVVAMACKIAGCPISMVSLVDKDRQWFKAGIGLDAKQTGRDISFCGHAINQGRLFEVQDALNDERFKDNPLVADQPSIRFYAGQPLVTRSGHKIGTLCVIDREPRQLTDSQKSDLQTLARVTVQLLEGRIARLKTERELRELDTRENAMTEVNRKLADAHFKLNDTLQKMPVAIAFLEEPEHKFAFTNPAYDRIFGHDGGHAGKRFREVNAADHMGPIHEILNRAYATGQAINVDEFHHTVNHDNSTSQSYVLQICAQPQKRLDGTIYGIAVIVVDVTGAVRDRENVAQANRELEEEKSLREKFVDTITHDLRNPLSAARMSAQIFMRKANPDVVMIRTLSQRIIVNIDRAEKMIGNLLDANRLKAGKGIPVWPEETSLNAVVAASLETLTTLYGARFQVREPGTQVNGHWDSLALQRVLENLCGNAIKYGSPDRPVVITFGPETGGAFLSVYNHGNPIPEADWDAIFQPYARADAAVAGQIKGWGIGLSLVKGITLAHNGFVGLMSSDAGTTFTVHLPLYSETARDQPS